MDPSRRALHAPLVLVGLIALAGCEPARQSSEGFLSSLTPYRMEVVQGNIVTREQVAMLRPGLSRTQVRDILGSPLLASVFHADRWDYVFTIRRQGAEPQSRRVVVTFEGDRLKSIDTGGELPSEREFVASIDAVGAAGRPVPLALTEEQLRALPVPPTPAAAPGPITPAPGRTYPPLEPR